MQVRKEIIRQGKHTYIGADGRPAILDATADRIIQWHKNGAEMLAANLPVPVPLEHDPEANPKNAAQLAANLVTSNTGFVKSYELDKIKDAKTGEEIQRLIGILDIKDEKVGDKIRQQTIPFVSPWITSFTDGNGKHWDDVIGHVALTTRPRIADQQPFASIPLSVALSSATINPKIPQGGISLSMAGRLKKNGKPVWAKAFSMMAGIRLSKEEIAEAEKEGEEKEKSKEREPEGEERKSPLDDPANNMESADVSIHETIQHLLKALGFKPPDGMSEGTFERDIYETLMAKMHELCQEYDAKAKEIATNPEDNKDKPKPPGPVQQESPPMYMSLTANATPAEVQAVAAKIKMIADSKERQTAEAFLSLHEQSAALRQKMLNEAAAKREQRVTRLMGIVPQSVRDKLAAKMVAPGAQLSLSKDGTIFDPMSEYLEMFEESFKGLPDILKNGMKFSEEDHPAEIGTVSNQRAQQLAENMLGGSRMGEVAPVKPAA